MPKCNVTIKGGSVSRGYVFQCNNNETRYCQRDVPPNIGIKDVVLQLQWFTKNATIMISAAFVFSNRINGAELDCLYTECPLSSVRQKNQQQND